MSQSDLSGSLCLKTIFGQSGIGKEKEITITAGDIARRLGLSIIFPAYVMFLG